MAGLPRCSSPLCPAAVEAIEVAIGLDEDVLRDVERLLLVPDHPPDEPEDTSLVGVHDLRERLKVLAPALLD